MVEHGTDNEDVDVAIPVSDAIPNEVVITYDKGHPTMDLDTMYPSMKEFRLEVRQFAINEEFDLGTKSSSKGTDSKEDADCSSNKEAYTKEEATKWMTRLYEINIIVM
ncbi:hypothetical protein D1007_25722 [Hordeum vulgare]|nr:hypothetical protein D1007_25722 [Hordeum vulgare]